MKRSRVIAALVLAGAASTVPAPQDDRPKRPDVGTEAPALESSKQSNGRPVRLEQFAGRAVAVVFWSGTQEFGRRGVTELIERLNEAEAPKTPVVILVSPGREAWDQIRERCDPARAEVVLASDSERKANGEFGVVALPTAFVLDGERKIVHTVRGFGPLFAFSVHQGLRLAAGEIDETQLAEILSARGPRAGGTAPSDRTVELARRLVATGQIERARDLLEKQVQSGDPRPAALTLLARIALSAGDVPGAEHWLGQLGDGAPPSVDTRLLRVAVALANGDVESAEVGLESLDENQTEVRYYRGRVLECRGRWEEAARMYRGALESALPELR